MQVKYSKNKTREFIYLDDKEKRYNDIMNEYGYNFDNPHINEEILELQAYRPKNTVNKDFFIIKWCLQSHITIYKTYIITHTIIR